MLTDLEVADLTSNGAKRLLNEVFVDINPSTPLAWVCSLVLDVRTTSLEA